MKADVVLEVIAAANNVQALHWPLPIGVRSVNTLRST